MIVGSLIGPAEAVLALDLDVVETVFEGERTTLARCGSAAPLVISANLMPNSFSRSRVSWVSGNSDNSSSCSAVCIGQCVTDCFWRHRMAGHRKPGKGGCDDAAARGTGAVAPVFVPRRIGP
jgi:hypothetical protein